MTSAVAEEEGLWIALVGNSENDARAMMIEGAFGLRNCARPTVRNEWEHSGGLKWGAGAARSSI